MPLYGALEAGGTKFICAVSEAPDAPPHESISIPTTTPDETIAHTLAFFKKHAVDAIGVASFGPIELHTDAPTYGYITATPKPGWRNTDLIGALRRAFDVPFDFDTDVNGAALGEWRYGAGRGLNAIMYMTVGTGIGGGAIVDGQRLHGLLHPEMGHVPVRRHPQDSYKGHCPYHGDCLEGMACGPAIQARWGVPGSDLPADHTAWDFEAYYLAQAVCAITYVLSPQRAILGGGVMHQPELLDRIRRYTVELLNGYIQNSAITERIDSYIVSPGLGDRSGAVGALEMARLALNAESRARP